ncbi:MAG: excalibur calcium-binding domain-containing protein [Rhodanobacter sp.]
MTSCAEATFFLKQCPGTQMDGDGDGKLCESQWCSGSRED